jgi:hypothetical protein
MSSGPETPRSTVEEINAVSCCEAVRFGYAESNSASPPATCGADMEVPEDVV